MGKKGLRIIEVLVIVIVLAVVGLLVLPMLRKARLRANEATNRTICASQLKQWASVLAIYAEESKGGLYPPIQTKPFIKLAVDATVLYPKYLDSPALFFCPSGLGKASQMADLKALPVEERRGVLENMNQSYAYFGWVFDRTAELPEQCLAIGKLPSALAATPTVAPSLSRASATKESSQVCAQMALTLDAVLRGANGADEDVTLETPQGNLGGKTVRRLRKGIECMLTTDANPSADALARQAAGVPVMMDVFTFDPDIVIFNHMPGGSNVLFLDGHVDFWKYPAGPGPVTRPVGRLLRLLLQ